MENENISSPRRDTDGADKWTPDEMEHAQPFPLPEVPSKKARPRKRAPGAHKSAEQQGQVVEGHEPE